MSLASRPTILSVASTRSHFCSTSPVLAMYDVMCFAFLAALASPEGQATANDLANFATGGAVIYFADTKSV